MSNTVHGASCSYSNLSNYNSSPFAPSSSHIGYKGTYKGTETHSKNSVIPSFGMAGYNVFAQGTNGPTCAGYFDIMNGYQMDGKCYNGL